jgi:hypothetical protein
MHLIINPVSPILSTISIPHSALAILTIVSKLSHKDISIGPLKGSKAVFLVVEILSFKDGAIRPLFSARATPLIHDPLSFVDTSTASDILAISMGLVILPLPNIDISIWMEEATRSLSLAIEELPRVGTFIREVKLAHPVANPVAPLPEIVVLFGQFIRPQHNRLGIEDHFGRSLFHVDRILQLNNLPGQLVQGQQVPWTVLLHNRGVPRLPAFQLQEGVPELIDAGPLEVLKVESGIFLATTAHTRL